MRRANSVVVIMRTQNSADVVDHPLAALFSQNFPDFELLVVDSGSRDSTLEIVSRYPHRLIQIKPEDYFPGKVLNGAIEATDSELVVFLNSDCVPLVPTALGDLVAAFDDEAVQGAVSRQIPRPEAHGWVRRDYAESFPARGELPPWITLSLPMAAIRRSAWERHHFYLDAWGSEDTEWGRWARREGFKIAYVPSAIVMHSHNYTLEQLYGRGFIEGEADAFIYDGELSLLRAALGAGAATVRDWRASLSLGDYGGLVMAPFRRVVSQWARYRGHRHGRSRKARGDSDISVGQQTVLSRHESSR